MLWLWGGLPLRSRHDCTPSPGLPVNHAGKLVMQPLNKVDVLNVGGDKLPAGLDRVTGVTFQFESRMEPFAYALSHLGLKLFEQRVDITLRQGLVDR